MNYQPYHDEVVAMYNEGHSTKEIAERFAKSSRYIRRILTNYGVRIQGKRRTGGYKVDEDFFKSWTNEMAYVLGFVLTDGSINRSTLTIAQKELEILERINSAMGSTYKITSRANGRGSINILNINRKEIVQDLAELGIGPNKSLTVTFPEIPDKYLPHFIRGVVDGDGYVHPKGYVVVITSGSKSFAESLADTLTQHDVTSRVIEEEVGRIYRIRISGKENVSRLRKLLYADGVSLKLDRKFERMLVAG